MSKQKTVMVIFSVAPLALQKGDISSKYAALLVSAHKEWSLISITDLLCYLEKTTFFRLLSDFFRMLRFLK